MDDVYAIEYAPDGEHYHIFKRGKVGKMWDYFVMDSEIREAFMLCPQSKFRLRNASVDRVIVVLKFDRKKREFLHLRKLSSERKNNRYWRGRKILPDLIEREDKGILTILV